MRREPRAVLVWMLLWLAVLSAAAWAVAMGARIDISKPVVTRNLADVAQRFGPFAVAFIVMFLLVWATTTVASYRAVLRPDERKYFFLRLGMDELRVAIMTVAAFVLVLVFGGTPAYLLYLIFTPIMQAVPALARYIEFVGVMCTVALEVWLGVRLSLIAVETFAERRFHLSSYWPVTRGRFWYLLSCYVVLAVVIGVLSIVVFSLNGLLFEIAFARVGAGDFVRRLSVLAIAGILAVLTASLWVLFWTLFCACQAHAFRAIVGKGKAGVAL